MHKRQTNRQQYFNELSITSSKYFIPYVSKYLELSEHVNVLEIGCGDGGNLLPFAKKGCNTVGADIAGVRIDDAITFFKEAKTKGKFIEADIFKIKEFEYSFDLIICHDVFEHIETKALFLSNLRRYLRPNGIVFISFPAWQMPFGGPSANM